MFLNMKSIVFNQLNCLCEKIDNSISANSRNIIFRIDSSESNIIISDDGDGMKIEQLQICGRVMVNIKN